MPTRSDIFSMFAGVRSAKPSPSTASEVGELPPLPILPQSLLDLIGEYGMARTDGMFELDRLHLWEMLIRGIKCYATDYARAALAAKTAETDTTQPLCDSALRAEPAGQHDACTMCNGIRPLHCGHCEGMGIEPRKIVGYGDCRCILSQYCDGKCNPIWEDAAARAARIYAATRSRAEGGNTQPNGSGEADG